MAVQVGESSRAPVILATCIVWINDADLIYLISLLGYKMSILVLYLRLFSVNKTFKYVTWSMMFFVSGYLFSNFWTQIFGCSPREKYWLPETPGHCINYTKAGLAYGAMNFASDLFIFVLPLPTVWRLNLPVKEKVGVSLIFMSGAITCAAAITRTIEINVGVMCSCMPAFRPILARILPKLNVSRSHLPVITLSRLSPRGIRWKYRGTPEATEDSIPLEARRRRSNESNNVTNTGHLSPARRFGDGSIGERLGV
ncbi:MAG: hypothetical protein L6R39_003721 [Caloplaca ligustica]|nr:MAG: hypothetical protein L6R39_003721 [Caloplaca ligustica]